MIDVYFTNVDVLKDQEKFEKYLSQVCLKRQQKINRYKQSAAKRLSLGAWLMLLEGLKTKNLDVNSLVIEENINGKPFIKNASISFNLSHSGNFAVCAFSDKEIGIDLQKVEKLNKDISSTYFSKEEDQWIKQSIDQIKMFTIVWSLKESLAKAKGSTFLKETKENSVVRNKKIVKTIKGYHLYYQEFLNEYIIAICSKNSLDEQKILFHEIKL